ncbi:CD99 molecule isoform X3 [Kryptolebias marmoratus]|uniref:CD99 molecule isoform X3 n=1 Tax=Kryptolebias marmoratus TaxID=37003 RepID=UPI0007F93D76|nr:CD99 molecule isoform X3 [Kryptolebias marmoratus]
MKFCLGTLLLLFLVPGSSTQDGFDLADAFDDVVTPPPKLQPKPPEKPKTDGELDLSDAFGPDDPATEKPKKPSSGGFDDFRFDLEDALKPDPNAKTDKPAIVPPKGGGGGGTFDDSDLFEVGAGDYKPDGGRSGNRANDPESDTQDRTNDPGSDTQDPDHKWGQVLKMLYANMPEEFFVWMSNLKQVLTPLLERVQDLLQALP